LIPEGTKLGRYEIRSKIGEGGGEVYRFQSGQGQFSPDGRFIAGRQV